MDALIAILPVALLFLLCPLMMLFMHRGQDHQKDDRDELLRLRGGGSTASATSEEPTSPTAHHERRFGLSADPGVAASFGSAEPAMV